MNPTLTPRHKTAHLGAGLALEYVEQGHRGGTPLLLLHGITDSWRSYEPVLPWLPPEWHVIALSQRGHGASSHGVAGFGLRDFAGDIAALSAHLELPPMLVVGHSMGAAVAMRVAIDHPGLVAGLVGVGAFASFSDKDDLRSFHAGTIAPLLDPVPAELAQEFQQSTVFGPVAPGLLQTMVQESLKVPAHVWRAAFAALFDDDFTAELPRIEAPALLARGDADVFVPRSDQDRLLQALQRARLTVLRGVGHAVHWERPQAFVQELLAFAHHLQRRGQPLACGA